MLRSAKKSDAGQLAKIHHKELKGDFLPGLGELFLRLLYSKLLDRKETIIWVYITDGKICGFISGSVDFNNTFKYIILHNFAKFSFLIIPQLFKKPSYFIKILETLIYPKKEGPVVPKSELIAICILKEYHRRGIGRKLVGVLEENFLKYGVKNYKVTVNATNAGANKFYSSLGFKKHHSFVLYKKQINLYTKQIK